LPGQPGVAPPSNGGRSRVMLSMQSSCISNRRQQQQQGQHRVSQE
jgi:hypothetical protein